ncbi:MAG TPA: UvrD-helicase domain-containing protein, partial [bacterium]|nr:UvrD-helicase domain-containing protein [bacterium]
MKKTDFNAVMIEASAGTGKTSRITREFTGLLGKEDPAGMMKRIIAITFSEKAAIEMKSRILEQIYKEIYPSLGEIEKIEAENAMLKLNISTIHSFCRRILRRFSFYLKIDPFFRIADEGESNLLFYRSFGKVLNREKAGSMADSVLRHVKLRSLKDYLSMFQKSHPYVSSGIPAGDMTKRMAFLFSMVSDVHSDMKREKSLLDFNDLEKMAYGLLSEHPEALNILEDFDEMCNYVFVDEFQDTNIIQWEIIHKFFEEWLAGYGAKADRGESYGVFLVGDKKQSIYKFRGAESGIFDVAKDVMSDYLKEEQLSMNYRSSKGILDFVNNLFDGISPWSEQKLCPGIEKDVPSVIEIKLVEGNEAKHEEYRWVVSRIFELVEKKYPVWDRKSRKLRPIDFKDIAILMRGRAGNNFTLLEKTLKEAGLPFVILGGIGFYEEPEVIFLL